MTLRKRLRGGTATEHKRLEERLALTGSTFSLDHYVEYLGHTYAYYAAVEPVLRSSKYLVSYGINAAAPSELNALARDLASFDKSTPPLATGVYVPAHGSTPELLGCSYVIEGAALGGMVLYRHFQQRFGLSRHSGASFFYGNGVATARKWADFVEALDQTALRSAEERECVAAARATFHSMNTWFAEKGWPVS